MAKIGCERRPLLEESGMAKEALRKAWIKPALRHLGKIRDVAGAETPNSQAGNSKS